MDRARLRHVPAAPEHRLRGAVVLIGRVAVGRREALRLAEPIACTTAHAPVGQDVGVARARAALVVARVWIAERLALTRRRVAILDVGDCSSHLLAYWQGGGFRRGNSPVATARRRPCVCWSIEQAATGATPKLRGRVSEVRWHNRRGDADADRSRADEKASRASRPTGRLRGCTGRYRGAVRQRAQVVHLASAGCAIAGLDGDGLRALLATRAGGTRWSGNGVARSTAALGFRPSASPRR